MTNCPDDTQATTGIDAEDLEAPEPIDVLHRSGQWCPGLRLGAVIAYEMEILPRTSPRRRSHRCARDPFGSATSTRPRRPALRLRDAPSARLAYRGIFNDYGELQQS